MTTTTKHIDQLCRLQRRCNWKCKVHRLWTRDVREWLSTFPFSPSPIPISVFYSNSRGIPMGFPFPLGIPFPCTSLPWT